MYVLIHTNINVATKYIYLSFFFFFVKFLYYILQSKQNLYYFANICFYKKCIYVVTLQCVYVLYCFYNKNYYKNFSLRQYKKVDCIRQTQKRY